MVEFWQYVLAFFVVVIVVIFAVIWSRRSGRRSKSSNNSANFGTKIERTHSNKKLLIEVGQEGRILSKEIFENEFILNIRVPRNVFLVGESVRINSIREKEGEDEIVE